jgi:NAD(P)-dependent dehydrogenase (short-subunit alcohol dehydrogenase family)
MLWSVGYPLSLRKCSTPCTPVSGIRVNSINPGMVKTEGLDELAFITQEIRDGAAMTPMRRVGEPEDIAVAAVIFAPTMLVGLLDNVYASRVD